MGVQTVLGVIDKSALGKTSVHEHIYIDINCLFVMPDDPLFTKPLTSKVSIENLGDLRRNPHYNIDNGILDDFDVALKEIMEFKYAGGGTIVCVSNNGLGRSPEGLKRLAVASGLNLIMGSGYYVAASHPADYGTRPVEAIAEEIEKDILCGVGETGVKSGVIGEIAVSPVMHPDEGKTIAAGAMAQKKTGLGFHIHIYPWGVEGNRYPLGLDALDIAEKNGADLSKVSINHVDVAANINLEYATEIAKRGAWVQFDNFSHEYYIDKRNRKFIQGSFETDINRVRALGKLIEAGYLKQLLVASDTCRKNHLHCYGGWGYDHLLTNIIPMMQDEGFDDTTIKTLYVDNPARFLDSPKII